MCFHVGLSDWFVKPQDLLAGAAWTKRLPLGLGTPMAGRLENPMKNVEVS